MTEDSDPERPDEVSNNSRRRFLAGSAGALGGLALGGAFATPALAEHDESGNNESTETPEGEPPEMPDAEFEDDVAILNYALTLEFLEYRFYERGLENISEETLPEEIRELGDLITEQVYKNLEMIRDHEETHVDTLSAVIEDLGGDPVEEPEFDFGSAIEEAEEFIATAVVLEDTGVGAYAGAAPFIENEDLVPPALSIHSVEARHASFLRLLDKQVPFPNAFDEALSRSEVLEAASQFIVE